MATLGADSFSRADQSGFGTASDTQAWAQAAGTSTASIVSNKGQLTGNTGVNAMLLGTKTFYDFQMQCRMSHSNIQDKSALIARATGNQTYYDAEYTNGNLNINLFNGGANTTLASFAFSETAGASYQLKFLCIGFGTWTNNLFAKVWLDGGTEPANWQLAVSDSTISGVGQFGVRGKGFANASILKYDTFSAVDPTTSLPTPTNAILKDLPYGSTAYVNANSGSPLLLPQQTITDMQGWGNGTWIRYQLPWSTIEQVSGQYLWSVLDDAVARCNIAGLNMCFCLQSAPTFHLTIRASDGATVTAGTGDLPNATDMTNYATAVASRYNGTMGHGIIQILQIGNEEWDTQSPRDTQSEWLVPLVNAAGPAIKAVYANCIVAICSVRKTPSAALTHVTNWTTNLMTYSGGCGANFQKFDLHYYRGGSTAGTDPAIQDADTPSIATELSTIKALLAQYGYPNIGVMCGETGWDAYDDGNGVTTTLSLGLLAGTAYTSLPVAALSQTIPKGTQITIDYNGTHQELAVSSAQAASGATAIPVNSITPAFSHTIGASVYCMTTTSTVNTWAEQSQYLQEMYDALRTGGADHCFVYTNNSRAVVTHPNSLPQVSTETKSIVQTISGVYTYLTAYTMTQSYAVQYPTWSQVTKQISYDTYSRLGIFQYFGYNMTTGQATADASRYPFVIADSHTIAAAFKAGNATLENASYFPYRRDNGSWDSFGSDKQNLAWWQANHPDWILYKADQTTPAYSFGNANIPLDIQNPAVVAWFVSQYATAAAANGNYTYMFADNVTLSNDDLARGAFKGTGGAWVQLYTGTNAELAYRQALLAWVTAIKAQLASMHMKLIINLSFPSSIPTSDATLLSIVAGVDGMMDEGGFSNYSNGNITGSAWTSKVAFMQTVQQIYGKNYYLVHQLPADTPANRQYGFASYLMGKYHNAYFFMTPMVSPGVPAYGSEHYYAEYTAVAKLGSPTEDMTLDQSVYRRKFNGGLILVNPDASATYSYTLSRTYVDLYGNYYGGSISLAPTSALVLLIFPTAVFPTIKRRGSIASNYAINVLNNKPLAYYRLGDTSGTTALDSSGNRYDGIISGGVTLNQSGAIVGDTDGSMLFNGSSGLITLPQVLNGAGFTSLSLEMWFKLSNLTFVQNAHFISSGFTVSSKNGYDLYIPVGANLMSLNLGNGTSQVGASIVITPSTSTWFYILMTWDGTNIRQYLGVNNTFSLQNTVPFTGPIADSGLPPLIGKIATAGNTNYFPGYIDEVGIYASALTLAQGSADYYSGLAARGNALLPSTKRRQS